jgi:DNA-directed RNA polymerase subunit RPC12/RpoP
MSDVTDQVTWEDNDGECLPLTKCVCGTRFDAWSEIVSIYKNHPWTCPKCGVKLIFSVGITVKKVDP